MFSVRCGCTSYLFWCRVTRIRAVLRHGVTEARLTVATQAPKTTIVAVATLSIGDVGSSSGLSQVGLNLLSVGSRGLCTVTITHCVLR